MKSLNQIKFFLVLLSTLSLIILIPDMTNAEQRVIVKEYTYKASDIDSKISSRAIAIDQVKRIVLEEIGSLVYVKTEVKNYQLESDQITSLTAGIVGIKVLDEIWDGESYYIKAQATVDDENIAKDINALLQNQNQVAEIESVNKKVDELLVEIEKLKADFQSIPDQSSQKQEYLARYDDSINQLRSMELVQDSYVNINSGNYEGAKSTLNSAYALSPVVVGPTVYIARSIVYARQNQYQQAFSNLDRSLNLNPRIAHRVALNRAFVYERSGNKEKALNEINNAILLNPRFAPAYHQRASAYQQQGYPEKARDNKMLAIKIQKQERREIANIETKRQEIIKRGKERVERIRQQQEVKSELERQQRAAREEKSQEKTRQRELRQQQKQQKSRSQQQTRPHQEQQLSSQQQRKHEAKQQKQARSQQKQEEEQQQGKPEAGQHQQAAPQQGKQQRQQKQESKQYHQKQEPRQHQGQEYRR